ncbi:MAG: dihydrolipoyl dehydrogenase [Candidatus Latescibacterota bacterium]
MKHAVVVLGAGSAGYAAASAAHRYGADVGVVDHGPLGGVCILRGCMPSKILLRSGELMQLMRRTAEFGLLPVEPRADLAAIINRKERLVRDFARHRITSLRDGRFRLYEETGVFLSPHELRVGSEVLEAERFIIATGSVPRHVPIPGLDDVRYITSDEALDLRQQPASLLVLGGGPVALEMAQFFQRIGTQVTLIQRSHHVLSGGDEDMARPVEAHLRQEGMEVWTGTQLRHFTQEGDAKVAAFVHQRRERRASAQEILQALGRRANIEGLGLEAAQVRCDHGHVVVNAEMRTSQPHIFCVGDANGQQEIVHTAIEQAEVAAYNATHPDRPPHRMDYRLKVHVTFTDPAVASVGLSEKECQFQDIPYLVASYPFDDHGKSITLGELQGHVKLLCAPRSGELLGAHIVGPQAGELIHELIAVMHFRGTVRDLLEMPHYHPTLAEIVTYPAEELTARL